MFTVEQKESRGFTRYLLRDTQAGTSAELTPARGGMLTSLTANGREYLYLDEANFYSQERLRCAMPVLFPCCGRMQDGVLRLDGREYPMEIHGVAHRAAWGVAAQYAGSEASVTLELRDSERTRASFPFPFQVLMRYTLCGSVLTVRQEYRNTGEREMPFSYGFHPYFRVSALENAAVYVDAASRMDPAGGGFAPFTPGEVALPVTDTESGAFFAGARGSAVLTDRGDGRRVRVSFDESFTYVMLWSLCQKGFLCVEPWNGVPDGLNTGGHLTLAPGSCHTAQFSITVEA